MDETEKKRILIIVEGAKTDVNLMKKVISHYPINESYKIVSYCTNLYALYQEMVTYGTEAFDTIDLLLILKNREKDPQKKQLFDARYTDMLLIFDLDPQDSRYNQKNIIRLQEYFSDSSDMGKLYINYPMVEAFYHMQSIPDPEFAKRTATIDELKNKQYKTRVQRETMSSDYRKFATTTKEVTIVIRQNLAKAHALQNDRPASWREPAILNGIDHLAVLQAQLKNLKADSAIAVLSTCVFFVADYNPAFLELGK
jgi:hypothetical protein